MDFSLVLPTKGNLPGLLNLVTSFIDKAKDKDCIEFLIAVDMDDPELYKLEESVKGYPVKVFRTYPTDNFNRDYFNWLTWKSCGKSIWCMNDDVVMTTQDWDEIIREKIHGKEFYFVDTWDTTHEQGGISFPRFPLISRASVDVIGFLMYPQVRTYPADRVIYDLYRRLDLIVPCHEVKLQHDWVESTDPSKSKMLRIFMEDVHNGVFPVNAIIEMYKMTIAMKMEWDGTQYRPKG